MSQPAAFDVQDLVFRAWRCFTRDGAVLVGALVVAIIVMMVVNYVASILGTTVGSAVSSLVMGPFLLGFYAMALDSARGRNVQFGTLFSGFNNFFNAALASLIISVLTMIGVALVLVPGLLVAALYLNTYLFMVEGTPNFWEAMEKSRKFAMEQFGQWLIVVLLVVVLNLAGLVACGVGLLISGPMCALVVTLAHEQQRAGAGSPPQDAA